MDLPSRLKKLIQELQHTSASFADEIGVQRSSISHVLSGRNKPGLDFIQKVLIHFPDTDINWLITGKEKTQSTLSFETQKSTSIDESSASIPTLEKKEITQGRKVNRIVLFYEDNTFEEFLPGN